MTSPGPWRFNEEARSIVDAEDGFIAYMSEQYDCKADAHLIAAAPELMEALEEVVRLDCKRCTDGCSTFPKIQAALKKARGAP